MALNGKPRLQHFLIGNETCFLLLVFLLLDLIRNNEDASSNIWGVMILLFRERNWMKGWKEKSADRSGGPWKISQRSTLSRLKAGSFRLLNAFDMAAFGLSLILVKGGERLEERIYSCSLGSHGQLSSTIFDLQSVSMIEENSMNIVLLSYWF